MQRIYIIISVSIIFAFSTAYTVFGQQNSINDTIDIDPLVVTATRTDNHLLDVPVRIHALTASVLSSIPMQSVDDALKSVPGVNINRPFGILSTKATISMRGLSGKEQGRVLVLLDGIPLNKSDGGTVDWNMIDLADICMIEVTKGAGSSVYGGSAMGGMINIITSKPQKKLQVSGAFEYSSYNTIGSRLGLSGNVPLKNTNRFYWSMSSLFRKSDGYITQSEAERNENPYIVKSDMQEAGINIRAGYIIKNKHTIETLLKYYDDCRGSGEKVYQPKGNTTDHDSYGLVLNYTGTFASLDVKSSAFILSEDYTKVNEYKKDDYTWYNVLSNRNDMGILNSLTYSSGRHTLMAGIDLKSGSVDGEDVYLTSTDVVYNNGKIFNLALFIQDEFEFNQKLGIIAGIRYDNSTFHDGAFYIENQSAETSFMYDYQVPEMPVKNWSAISPRLSIQYKLDNQYNRLYAGVSRGFRPSELEYLCRSGRVKGGFKIASPSLKPEFLTNFEAGLDLKPVKDGYLSGSIYFSRGNDFQYYVSNGQTIDMGFGSRPVFIRDNLGSVNIFGTEADFQYLIYPGITINGSYAYAHSEILNYSAVLVSDTINLNGKSFTDVPDHIVTLGLKAVTRLINGSFLIRYTGEMFVNDQNVIDEVIGNDQYPANTMVDIKIWKEFQSKYRVSLSIQNLTDVKYYDSKYSVCPGRFITAAVDFRL